MGESANRSTQKALRADLVAKALLADAGAPLRLHEVVEQILVVTDATLIAVYAVRESSEELFLVESAGLPRSVYGLLESYPLNGPSPVAMVARSGQSLWLTPADLTAHRRTRPLPTAEMSMAVLPLKAVPPHASGSATLPQHWAGPPDTPPRGVGEPSTHIPCEDAHPPAGDGPDQTPCPDLKGTTGQPPAANQERLNVGALVVISDEVTGFDSADRHVLEGFAARICAPLKPRNGTTGPARPGPVQPQPDSLTGSFNLTVRTGRVDADERVLDLFGLTPDDFDGQVATLLSLTVPEDLPALMAFVEPTRLATGSRELEFRIRRPTGELSWLRLRSQLTRAADGSPARLLGTVADASRLRARADDVAKVQRLAAALSTAVTVQDVSRAVVAALRRPLGADRVALAEIESDRLVVTVLDPPEQDAWPQLWRSEWRSEWPDAPTGAIPTVEAALIEGRASLWPSGSSLEPALAEVGPGGLAVLPLPAAGRMVGVCLLGWDSPHEFASEERALLTATAGLVGQALVRARAFDAEHELVGMLQRSMLPRSLPALPGGTAAARYLPATAGLEVGGDWYDVIRLPDGRVALIIGDVQGHNAKAAALMGQMRTAIRAYAVEGHPPDVVVSHANHLLLGMDSDLFATCVYVAIDMEEGDAWCVRAGHLPPVLRHPDGTSEVVRTEGGPPLGVVADAEYPMSLLRLLPGTVLALTTDGLVESASLAMDDGLDELCSGLSMADPAQLGAMADALLDSATRRDDDVALLLLRYDGMPARPVRARWTVWRLPEAVSHARRFTGRTLRGWRLREEVDTALLIVSELVTNALVHTQGQIRLDLTLLGGRLRIAVSDSSPRAPAKPTNVSWEATGGRGILLVDAMSMAWGSVPLSGGKQVWADLPLPDQGRVLASV